MREHAVRRLPVIDGGQVAGGQVAGVVSLGDLAMQDDPASALSQVGQANPNA